MTDDTLIADLVKAGVSAELVGRVANALVREMSGTNVRDMIRLYERERKRNQRKTSGKQTMSAVDDAQNVPDNVPDTQQKRCDLSSFLSSQPLQEEGLTKKKETASVVEGRKGTRLPGDWQPREELRAWARAQGVSDTRIDGLVAEFRDYWVGVPGQRGVKLDWPATFRNRVRQVAANGKQNSNGKRTVHDAANDLLANIRSLDEPAPGGIRSGEGQGAVRQLPPR